MYYIHIFDRTTKKDWTEYFESYYNFRKRVYKLMYSTKLYIMSRSLLEDEGL